MAKKKAGREAPAPEPLPIEMSFQVGQPNGRGTRLVVATANDVEHRDTLNTNNSDSRRKFFRELTAKLGRDFDLAEPERQLIVAAAEADAPSEEEPAEEASDCGRDRSARLLEETPPAILETANQFLENPDMFDEFDRDIEALGIVGEPNLARTTYIIGTSRKLSQPLGASVQSASASGKSFVTGCVVGLMPSEDVLQATSITAQALYYLPEGHLKNRLIVVAERKHADSRDSSEGANETLALREMLSSGVLVKFVAMRIDGSIQTVEIRQEGPIAYLETTTQEEIFEEDQTRLLQLSTDESNAQTRRIMRVHAREAAGLTTSSEERDALRQKHQTVQRLLRPLHVRIPYAERLEIPDVRVAARRSFNQLLGVIRAVALLRQRQKKQIIDDCINADSLNLDTRALDYLLAAARGGARLVILTGDAGHGKTHLCRRLLQEHLGFTESDARAVINERCDGQSTIRPVDDREAISLRIFKDLSEPSIDVAARYLEGTGGRNGEVVVVCVNEGRFRAILKSDWAGEVCKQLSSEFQLSFRDGLASHDDVTHIINLNYQSVASTTTKSLIGNAMHQWLNGRSWRICEKCDSRTHCSIYRNRQLLADSKEPNAEIRRNRIQLIYTTVERLGKVVTIREMLMSLAYMITGGLRCSDVHEKVQRGQIGWQHNHAFYNILFVHPREVSKESLARIPVLHHISHLDPGSCASRIVDERLVNTGGAFIEGEIDLAFAAPEGKGQIDAANGIDEIIGSPQNRNERLKEANFVQRVVRSLRRRTFFEDDEENILARLGFEHGDQFEELVTGEVEPARMTALKGVIVAGLHVMQGLQMKTSETNLHLVDPAFGNATSHAAIIACRIPSRDVKLLPMKAAWDLDESKESQALMEAVDWLDRYVVLRLRMSKDKFEDLHLDLLMFDFIARAGAGYIAEDFYSHDVRKVLNFLGRIAEQATASDGEISLFLDRRLRTVSIDDGVIQVGGGG